MRFYLETYGCTANFGNSKDFEAALVQEGHFPSDPEKAELFVINTCAVTEKTERKIMRRLRQLQGDRLIIAGCISVALPESLKCIDCRKCLGILSRVSANGIFAGFQDYSSSKTQSVFIRSCEIGPLWHSEHCRRLHRCLQLLHCKKGTWGIG
ncbi:MAG: hypothetical protein MUO26_03755 [Methanotrichaceae archaeon]|nr:hypothetical protein [Methanotrichaceae archaeon]